MYAKSSQLIARCQSATTLKPQLKWLTTKKLAVIQCFTKRLCVLTYMWLWHTNWNINSVHPPLATPKDPLQKMGPQPQRGNLPCRTANPLSELLDGHEKDLASTLLRSQSNCTFTGHDRTLVGTEAIPPTHKTQRVHCQYPGARHHRTPSELPCPCPHRSKLSWVRKRDETVGFNVVADFLPYRHESDISLLSPQTIHLHPTKPLPHARP